MFVHILKYYRFVENLHRIRKVDEPTWELIETAIRELDGSTQTAVTIAQSVESEENMLYTLTIGGGLSGQYTCSAVLGIRNEVSNLIDPSRFLDGRVTLPIGMQSFRIPAREAVSLDKVLQAARLYAETGEIDQSLKWEIVNPYGE